MVIWDLDTKIVCYRGKKFIFFLAWKWIEGVGLITYFVLYSLAGENPKVEALKGHQHGTFIPILCFSRTKRSWQVLLSINSIHQSTKPCSKLRRPPMKNMYPRKVHKQTQSLVDGPLWVVFHNAAHAILHISLNYQPDSNIW